LGELVVEGLSKRYGSVRALENVSARFASGEIHAVLGENGAGKSTLVGVLAGFVSADSGSVKLDGKPIPLGRPNECRHAGVAMVHQHFTLVPEFTVAENLALDRLQNLIGFLRQDELAEPALKLSAELNWPIEPKAKVKNLPVGVQQRLEILKVLADDSPVVIFDEPTAVLAPDEVLDLFRVLRDLKQRGKTVILIAHKLSEVLSVADRVTVLRRGQFVATASIGDVDENQLATWMVGDLPADLTKEPRTDWAKGDRGEDALRGITIDIRRGEILGIGGVDGNGQVELAEVAVGVRPISRGELLWDQSPEHRIAYIPQDRRTDGLALNMSILDNMLIEGHRRAELSRGPFLDTGAAKSWATRLVDQFQIKTPSASEKVGSLSGGNQQKVVVSRNLDQTPDLLVCVNPTRGLDIRAADFVQRQILKARDEGAAVLLISTDLDELAILADRTQFISRGELREALEASSLVGGT
jgi:ABC-type uncharacterized transport system ATPase subunit